eukprot:gene15513-17094_t
MAELTNAVKNIDGKLRFLEFLGEETEEIIEKNERKSITRQIKAYESKLEEIEELKLNIQELKIQAEEEPQEVRNWRKCISEKQKQFEPLLERLQTAIRGFEENDKKNKQQEKEQEYEKEISLEKMKLQQRFEMEKQLIATRGQTKMEVASRPVTITINVMSALTENTNEVTVSNIMPQSHMDSPNSKEKEQDKITENTDRTNGTKMRNDINTDDRVSDETRGDKCEHKSVGEDVYETSESNIFKAFGFSNNTAKKLGKSRVLVGEENELSLKERLVITEMEPAWQDIPINARKDGSKRFGREWAQFFNSVVAEL